MSNQLTTYRQSVTIADLTQRQAKFVQAYLELGGRRHHAIEAALAAGYGHGDRKQAKSRAYELLHDARVLSVLHDEASKKLSAATSLAVDTLIELIDNARSERVRLSAAVELLNRGFGPIPSRNPPPVDKEEQRQMRIKAFLDSLPPPPPVDADYETLDSSAGDE